MNPCNLEKGLILTHKMAIEQKTLVVIEFSDIKVVCRRHKAGFGSKGAFLCDPLSSSGGSMFGDCAPPSLRILMFLGKPHW